MSEDDPNSERCPVRKHKECQDHLLARLDASREEGELGVGLTAGPLYYVNEIEEVLQRARLSWVQSVRATGKRKAPRWIMKERGLQDYVDALGGLGGFDLEEYDSVPLRSTTYLSWWAFKPSEIVKGSGRNSEGSRWMPPTQ
jgi:hypothetical protein